MTDRDLADIAREILLTHAMRERGVLALGNGIFCVACGVELAPIDGDGRLPVCDRCEFAAGDPNSEPST